MRCSFYTALALLLAAMAATFYLSGMGAMTLQDATVYSSIALSLLFPVIVFSYLLAKGRTLGEITDELGLSRRRMAVRYAALGALLFLLFVVIEFGTALFSALTGIALPTNVAEVLGGLPTWFYVFTVFAAPVNEEILFRGFLVPRIGIVASSLVFGAVHYISYLSVVEFAAALAFGLVSGYILKRTKSLYPSIIGHVLINALGIAATFFP